MGLASGRRAHGASRRLLAWGAALLLLAVFVRPLFPPADAPAAFQDSSADYSLDASVPEQPVGAEANANANALAKRIQAGDGFGALVPATQPAPSPKVQFAAADRPPDDPPPPRAAASPRQTTGPPRLEA